MGSIWSRRAWSDFLTEPFVNNHFIRQTEDAEWVHVDNEGLHTQDLSDSMVLVNMPQQAVIEQTSEPNSPQDMTSVQNGQPTEDQNTEPTEGQEREPTQPVRDQEDAGAIRQHVEQTTSVLDDMTVGEVTEMKQKAIQSTMRKYAHQMCERISITCLAVILYSLEVIDYTVFAKFGNTSAGIMQDAHFLVSEVIKAVHEEAKKFEAFCRGISLVHSPTYADEMWSYYRKELERLQKSESEDVALKEIPALVLADSEHPPGCKSFGASPSGDMSISQRGNGNESPIIPIQRDEFTLHQACGRLEHDTVCRLVQDSYGGSVNVKDHEGNLPLHSVLSSTIACREHERLMIVKKLLQCNSDVSSVNKEGNTPLHVACRHGTEECVQLLFNTCTYDQTSTTKLNKNGHTALHLAVLRGHEGIVRVLLSHNASAAECPDEDGNTPLHVACIYKHSRIVEIILDHNKECLQLTNKAKMTALHFSCKSGDRESVGILLRNRVETHCLDENGDTPLHMACCLIVSGIHIVRMLLKKCTEACVNQANMNLETALHIAAYHGAYAITQKLLKHNAKPLAKDKNEKTPVDVARERNHRDVLRILEKKAMQRRLPSWSSRTSLSSQSSSSSCSLTSLAARK